MKNKYLFGAILTTLFFSMVNLVYANLVINEFLPNSVTKYYEWIELYNDGTSSINISQYNISEEGASKNFTVKNVVLDPNSFLVLVRRDEVFNQTYPTNGIIIIEYGDAVPSFDLNNEGDSIFLYDSSGQLIDAIKDYSDPGENVSIGRYPDGSSAIVKLMVQTPGAKNDNSNPAVQWMYPTNNTYVNYLVNIMVKITDDASTIEYAMINFNGTNYTMSSNNDQWSYLWDTSANSAKSYNITVFFKDSHNKYYADTIYNIAINNTEVVNQLNKIPVITLINLTNTDYLSRANGSLKISWLYSDDDNDAITDKEILWYTDGNIQTELTNITSIQSANIKKNQTWKASLRIFDSKNWSDFFNSSSVQISNLPITQSGLFITSSDSRNRKNGTLACNSGTSGLTNGSVTNFIRWYKNNAIIYSATGSSILNQGNYSKNDDIICEITPSDGFVNGTPLNSTDLRISNSAPVLISSIENKAWTQDNAASINLISSFMDPDGDQLIYTYNPIGNITVSIDNNKKIATLIPDKSFVGTRTEVFTASDGTDSASSNEIILTVNPAASGNDENKIIVNEKTENQEASDADLKGNSSTEAQPNESNIITGNAQAPESGGNKKINYTYVILSVLLAIIAAIYFIWRKLLKKEPI